MTDTDRKPFWNLGEAVMWIRTGDPVAVAGMWDLNEHDAVTRVLAAGPRRLPPGVVPLAIAKAVSPQTFAAMQERQPADKTDDQPLGLVLSELLRKVQSGRVGTTMIPANGTNPVRAVIDRVEVLDCEIRITLTEPVALWSRSRQTVAGYSPWFSSADVTRLWPARARKTSAATGAILHHLRQISTEEQPLTKEEALERCLREVSQAYPEAFKRAWRILESTRKRRRGQHGPRIR